MKIKVKYGPGDELHEIELRELNMMCHRGMFDIEIAEAPMRVVVIQSPDTIREGEQLEPHWAFWVFWEYMREPGGLEHLPKTLEDIRRSGTGFTHLAGLVNLFCKYTFEDNVLCHFRYPESHMHPDAQCAMGDLLIAMSKPWAAVMMHLVRGRRPALVLPIKDKTQEGEERDETS